MARSKTGGGIGTNGSRVRGVSVERMRLEGMAHGGRGLMAQVPNLGEQVRVLQGAPTEPSTSVPVRERIALARKQPLAASAVPSLLADPNAAVRMAVVLNQTAPAAALEQLVQDAEPIVRKWAAALLAKDPGTSPDILLRLAGDPDENVRWHVAGNPTTPPAALVLLSEDPSRDIRRQVALHMSTPVSVLQAFAGSTDAIMRAAVASNPAIPKALLEDLAQDSAQSVRVSAASNRKR